MSGTILKIWKTKEMTGNDREYILYAYRIYVNEPSTDNAYAVAVTLRNLFQYEKAIS